METYAQKDVFTCTNCGRVNVTNVHLNPKRKKQQHMLYIEDDMFYKLKMEAVKFGTVGDFVGILLVLYDENKHKYATPVE